MIAVSPGDELNLLCCMIAKQLGAKHTIARVRDPRYLKQVGFMSKQMGIDMIVNPEHEAAREAARLIRFPAAMKLEKLARGQVEIVEIHIGEAHPFIDLPLKEFKNKFNTNALVCAAIRGEEVFIPGGDFVIREGDTISIAGSRQDVNDLFVKIGLVGKQLKKVMLIGGGRISRYLATQLTGAGYKLKIIEKNLNSCDELAELFPKIQIINGDATDPDLLDEEGLENTDACVIMTASDQTNLIISMFANSRGVEKVISKIASPTYLKLSENAGVDSNITPQFLIIAKVLRYLRGLANTIDTIFQIGKGGLCPNFYTQVDEALEKRELIKLCILENSDEDPKQAAELLAQGTNSQSVQVIGRKIVLYRQAKEKENRKIVLPKGTR